MFSSNRCLLSCLFICGMFAMGIAAEPKTTDKAVPFFDYLKADKKSAMIAYAPSGLDPRYEPNHLAHATSKFRADLVALRPAFDGLILYGYHQASTPRILALAKSLKFRAVLLGIWQPKSVDEIDGVAKLVNQYHRDFALGVIVGNEGIHFKRYETEDLSIAAARLRKQLSANIPLTTSEPFVRYQDEFVRNFGDFLAANIHPVFDHPELNAKDAAKWVRNEALKLCEQTNKIVLVKETGFPHAGKTMYTLKTQSQFWSSYLANGIRVPLNRNKQSFAYFGVAFESFDLPWKAEASNLPIEKSWGLLSADRKPYPAYNVWLEHTR